MDRSDFLEAKMVTHVRVEPYEDGDRRYVVIDLDLETRFPQPHSETSTESKIRFFLPSKEAHQFGSKVSDIALPPLESLVAILHRIEKKLE